MAIKYHSRAIIENGQLGEVEVFINTHNEIVFKSEEDQFLFTLTKDEWEDVKRFVDEEFEKYANDNSENQD